MAKKVVFRIAWNIFGCCCCCCCYWWCFRVMDSDWKKKKIKNALGAKKTGMGHCWLISECSRSNNVIWWRLSGSWTNLLNPFLLLRLYNDKGQITSMVIGKTAISIWPIWYGIPIIGPISYSLLLTWWWTTPTLIFELYGV